jgi:prevent-host-death family protein
MVNVNINKILPVTEVRDSLNKIIDEVETTDEMYVVTKNGKPSAIIVGVHHLEKLTGIKSEELIAEPEEKEVKTTPIVEAITIDQPQNETVSAPIATEAQATPAVTDNDEIDSLFNEDISTPENKTETLVSDNVMPAAPATPAFSTPTNSPVLPEITPAAEQVDATAQLAAPVMPEPPVQAQTMNNQTQNPPITQNQI